MFANSSCFQCLRTKPDVLLWHELFRNFEFQGNGLCQAWVDQHPWTGCDRWLPRIGCSISLTRQTVSVVRWPSSYLNLVFVNRWSLVVWISVTIVIQQPQHLCSPESTELTMMSLFQTDESCLNAHVISDRRTRRQNCCWDQVHNWKLASPIPSDFCNSCNVPCKKYSFWRYSYLVFWHSYMVPPMSSISMQDLQRFRWCRVTVLGWEHRTGR